MTTVQQSNEVSASLLASVNGSGSSAASTAESAQDRFMTLLVTQMKNQDPLNPLDNAEVTSQLAQLSTVEGIGKINSTLETLIGNMQSSQSLEMSSLIGRDVLVDSNQITFDGTGGYFGVELPIGADDVTISITDSAGNTVRELSLGNQDIGILPLSWDGYGDDGNQVEAGEYTFNVSATINDDPVTANALSLVNINSITKKGADITLNLSNNTTATSDDLKQIF